MKRGKENEFSYSMSQQKVGEILGVSKQRVEQIEKNALKKIRKYLDENPSKHSQIHDSLIEVCGFDYSRNPHFLSNDNMVKRVRETDVI